MKEIIIAAAILCDDRGRLLLVRKKGTRYFMQPGGKFDKGENALSCLVRELEEELGLLISKTDAIYAGRFSAPAANEPGYRVTADLYYVIYNGSPKACAEIEELIWYDPDDIKAMTVNVLLAPLTRDCVLPLSHVGFLKGYCQSN